MIAEYFNIPRRVKQISTKLKTCHKRRNLKERLSESIINLMKEEISGCIDFMQSVREAKGYLSLAKRAGLVNDMRNSVLDYAQKTQELTFTSDTFGIEYKTDISGSEGIRYEFYIADKKVNRRKLREKKAVELSLKILNLMKREETELVEPGYIRREAGKYKKECRKIGCVEKVKELILKREEKIQEPTITGDTFGVYYAKSVNREDKRKIFDFFILRAGISKRFRAEYLSA